MTRLLLLLVAFLASALPVQAAPILFVASLAGSSEEPPNASPGTGFATVTIDEIAHTLEVNVTFADLLGTTTAAHIHVINGPADTDTTDTLGPVATTTPTFPGFPLGVTAGFYNQTFDTTLASTYRAGFLTDSGGTTALAEAELFDALTEGRAYLNIHTSVFGGGEIRGFLEPGPVPLIPEPASMVLLGSGLAVAAEVRRRRRRRVDCSHNSRHSPVQR